MNANMVFECSICGEPSTDICHWCTKDACPNHLCHKCHRCSDCCNCEQPLAEATGQEHARPHASPHPPQGNPAA